MFYLNYIKTCFTRNFSQVNLVGRAFTSPESMTSDEIKSLLWTAIELKEILRGKSTKLENIKNAQVTFILRHPSMFLTMPAIKAGEMLSVKLNIIIDSEWDSVGFMCDTMKFLEMNSDLILTECEYQCNLDKIKPINVPIFNVQTLTFMFAQTLAEIMAIHRRYGVLEGLKMAWIGPPTRVLNTYLCISPKLGMNMGYYSALNKDNLQSPAMLQVGKSSCVVTRSVLEESQTLEAALENAKVVVASKNATDMSLTFDLLKLAAPDCCALFELPRRLKEIDPALVDHEKCLVWEAVYNKKWIYAAIMMRLLCRYKHITEMPKFA